MEVCEIKVDTTKSLTLPWQETIIVPIGDVQLGAQGVDERRVRGDIAWGLEHNAYFLGMGEYLDIASPSNRQRLKAAALYDSTEDAIEEIVQQKVKQFLQLARESKGRWLGILEGHHLYEFRDGTTTDTRIAEALDAPFLGTCAFVRLIFKKPSIKDREVLACTIWCHHGVGSGVKMSAPLNKLENIIPYFDADIYLMGHQHKKASAVADRIYMTRQDPYRVSYKTIIIANTGGYLRGYFQGSTQGGNFPRGSYVERWMKPPVSLGCILLYVRPIGKSTNRPAKLDLNVAI